MNNGYLSLAIKPKGYWCIRGNFRITQNMKIYPTSKKKNYLQIFKTLTEGWEQDSSISAAKKKKSKQLENTAFATLF